MGREQDGDSYRSKLFHFRNFHDKGMNLKNTNVAKLEEEESSEEEEDEVGSPEAETKPNQEEIAAALQAREKQVLKEMEHMKEKFSKLLLGEDMSGGGKGVSSALALSNAITNLAASVFGEQSRLAPMSPERKARWRRELDWLLSPADHIVEFVASQQKNKDGSNMEIMVTKQRIDLHMNIPALKKINAMLLEALDHFKDQNEFYYLSKDAPDSEKGGNKRKDDKWWLPTVKVPLNGLSEEARRNLQTQKDCVTQVLKAAMAINAQVLLEMAVPESYIESLPKNGRSSLGDSIYKGITVDVFDPDQFLSTMDLSSEHKIVDLKNRIEASIVIWKRKMNQKDSKSGWGSGISLEKRELFEDRAESVLILIKHRYPGISQSSLDISKIQYNRDVGHAVLESYSRVLESLAYTVLSRIEDVQQADSLTQDPNQAASRKDELMVLPDGDGDNSMTLSDLISLGDDPNEPEDSIDDLSKEAEARKLNVSTNKRTSYLETLGGLRSPTSRH